MGTLRDNAAPEADSDSICWDSLTETSTFLSFDSYEIDSELTSIKYSYSYGDSSSSFAFSHFSTYLYLETPIPDGNLLTSSAAQRALFSIGMATIPWLWMGLVTSKILIGASFLSEDQLGYWRKTFQGVLAEFLFVNRLDPACLPELEVQTNRQDEPKPEPTEPSAVRNRTEFPVQHPPPQSQPHPPPQPFSELQDRGVLWSTPVPSSSPTSHNQSDSQNEVPPGKSATSSSADVLPPRVLVPLGAGKDSLTVYEMVKKRLSSTGSPPSLCWFFLGQERGEYEDSWRYQAIVDASGQDRPPIVMAHVVDDTQWRSCQMSPPYVDCGHPWAAVVAFSTTLACVLYGFDHIAVGNERSANEGNTVYRGMNVNHQYDKGYGFETDTHHYIRTQLGVAVYYFSALQHLWEVQIVREFVRYPKYLPLFISCNEPQSITRWCGSCAKCLFVCLLMGSWLPPPQVWAVFGDDILQNKSLQPILNELLGLGGALKPFECVGTREEVKLALHMCRKMYERHGWGKEGGGRRRFPYLLTCVEGEEGLGEREGEGLMRLLNDYNPSHLLPPWFVSPPLRIFSTHTTIK